MGLAKILNVDPFKNLKEAAKSNGLDLNLGKFSFKAYKDGKEVASADVDKGKMYKGTRTLEMDGVQNGVITTDEGGKAGFSAPAATYDMNTKDVVAPMGVQLNTKDATINAPAMHYDHGSQTVTAPGQLKGKIGAGNVSGTGMTIDVPSSRVKIGNVTYEGPVNAGQDGKSPEDTTKSWKINAEDSEFIDKDHHVYTRCRAESEDQIIFADRIEYDRKNDVLVATGNVRTFGTEANMVSDKATVRRKDSRAIFEGSVTMMVKTEDDTAVKEVSLARMAPSSPDKVGPTSKPVPKGDPNRPKDDALRDQESLRKFPAVVRAESIDYDYKKGERHAEITGSPQAHQELEGGRWRNVWADSGTYNGETKRLLLKSNSGRNARMRNSLGDDLRAVSVNLSTKKGDDYMKATDSQMTMLLDKEDDSSGSDTPAAKPADTKKGGG